MLMRGIMSMCGIVAVVAWDPLEDYWKDRPEKCFQHTTEYCMDANLAAPSTYFCGSATYTCTPEELQEMMDSDPLAYPTFCLNRNLIFTCPFGMAQRVDASTTCAQQSCNEYDFGENGACCSSAGDDDCAYIPGGQTEVEFWYKKPDIGSAQQAMSTRTCADLGLNSLLYSDPDNTDSTLECCEGTPETNMPCSLEFTARCDHYSSWPGNNCNACDDLSTWNPTAMCANKECEDADFGSGICCSGESDGGIFGRILDGGGISSYILYGVIGVFSLAALIVICCLVICCCVMGKHKKKKQPGTQGTSTTHQPGVVHNAPQ